ncbi:MAG: Rrf2 family protein [Crocinitomicaceae bacterium]|jgi:Rrf2 family protein
MISKRTKYGLKALSYLSKQTEGKPVLISEIATTQNISQKFLESILLDLKKKGFLGSKKGKGGGYYLIKPGDQITMASIFRALEGPIAWLPCVSLNYYEKCDDCVSEDTCELNHAMIEVRDSILKVVEKKTIADL